MNRSITGWFVKQSSFGALYQYVGTEFWLPVPELGFPGGSCQLPISNHEWGFTLHFWINWVQFNSLNPLLLLMLWMWGHGNGYWWRARTCRSCPHYRQLTKTTIGQVRPNMWAALMEKQTLKHWDWTHAPQASTFQSPTCTTHLRAGQEGPSLCKVL